MPEGGNYYIGAEILLPRGDVMARGHVVARTRDANGNLMGKSHTNPIFNKRTYQVEFAGDEVTKFTTNVIAESVYAKCNLEGNEYLLIDALVDYHRDNNAISQPDQQTTVWGKTVTHTTTAGWQICCQWKDGSTLWEKLSELNKSHPVQTAELLLHRGLTMSQHSIGGLSMCSRREISESSRPDT